MADVSHELGSLRFVVDSPLSSKVAMFNNQASQHKQSQLLNPFSNSDGRVSPKPQFSKDEYGKPLAGSLTEMRGQKANIHVMKEMLELCQIIDSEGYSVKDEPKMRVIPFGELFNIYNYISDKVVGILLRARKHKLVEFEGEMLFQRRDDDVPVFLLMPIAEIRHMLEAKMVEIKRASSPAPQATSVLLDKSAHQKKLKEHDAALGLPKSGKTKSRTPSPSPAGSTVASQVPTPAGSTVASRAATPPILATLPEFTDKLNELKLEAAVVKAIKPEQLTPEITVDAPPKSTEPAAVEQNQQPAIAVAAATPVVTSASQEAAAPAKIAPTEAAPAEVAPTEAPPAAAETAAPAAAPVVVAASAATPTATPEAIADANPAPLVEDKKIDVNNNTNTNSIINNSAASDVPLTEVIEATAVYIRTVSTDASKANVATTETSTAATAAAPPSTDNPAV